MASVGYYEPIEELSDATRDMHRAIVSLMDELKDCLLTKQPLVHK